MNITSSASGSMFVNTNGNKTKYKWDGKLKPGKHGYDVNAAVSLNGKRHTLKLKNQSLANIARNPKFMKFFKFKGGRKRRTRRYRLI